MDLLSPGTTTSGRLSFRGRRGGGPAPLRGRMDRAILEGTHGAIPQATGRRTARRVHDPPGGRRLCAPRVVAQRRQPGRLQHRNHPQLREPQQPGERPEIFGRETGADQRLPGPGGQHQAGVPARGAGPGAGDPGTGPPGASEAADGLDVPCLEGTGTERRRGDHGRRRQRRRQPTTDSLDEETVDHKTTHHSTSQHITSHHITFYRTWVSFSVGCFISTLVAQLHLIFIHDNSTQTQTQTQNQSHANKTIQKVAYHTHHQYQYRRYEYSHFC
mmetsp:Transcript_4823/g.9188  ORF Transcript_4823/g.9188 Transcript_4823/m.9188 type:complete len:273 (+) Transcript_4823:598-1416(+)